MSVVVLVLLAVMATVLVLQTGSRYLFNYSFQMGWDIPRLSFIELVLLSIPLGFRHHTHVGIDLLVDALPEKARVFLLRVNMVIMLVFCAVLVWVGIRVGLHVWDQAMPGLPISVGVFYFGLAFSQAHVILHLIVIMVDGHHPSERLEEL
jgi:TRAP-type C4-dicarboxylate transport system permease small subunit